MTTSEAEHVTQNASLRTDDFRPDVQGLRAVAVSLVILYHFNLLGLRGGYVGVDVFFVISGFVIAGVLLRDAERHGRPSLLTFYAHRARRIIPAATATLVATVVASYILFGRYATTSVANDARAAALFVANYHFSFAGTNYFAAQQSPSPLLHFWSLAVEEQFYVVIPAVILVVATLSSQLRRHLGWIIGVLVVASFAWSWFETSRDPISAYYSILTRAWELGVGVMVAILLPSLQKWLRSPNGRGVGIAATWLGAGMIVLAGLWYQGTTTYPGVAALLPVLGSALVIVGGVSSSRVGVTSLLSTRTFVFVGDLSFSLYLWHFPIIALAAERQSTPLSLNARLVCLMLTGVVSLLSFYVVERPFRTAKIVRQHSMVALGIGALGIAGSLLVATVALPPVGSAATSVSGHPDLAQLEAQIAAATKVKDLPSSTSPPVSLTLNPNGFSIPSLIANCSPPSNGYVVPSCAYGDTTAKKTVVLYGNSQAQMWAPALNWLGIKDHFKVVPIMKAACGVFIDPSYVGPNGQVSSLCLDFAEWSANRINHLRPSLVVIATTPGEQLVPGANPSQLGPNGRLPSTSTEQIGVARTTSDFVKFVHRLHIQRSDVVMLSNIPLPASHGNSLLYPNECLLTNSKAITTCSTPQTAVDDSEWHEALVSAAKNAHTPLVLIDPLVCAQNICPTVVGHLLVHFDVDHLSGPYAEYVADGLGQLLTPYLSSS